MPVFFPALANTLMKQSRYYIPAALLLLTLARFLALDSSALSPVEAHALECSHAFDFWHVSLGPVIPLLIKASTAMWGDEAFGVRFFSPLLILGASVFFWQLCKGLFDETTAAWALVVFSITPAVNLAAITMTPTTIGLFSSVSVLTYLRLALHTRDRWHQPWWLVGLSLTVAFMADWRLLMLAVAAAASLAITSRGRRALLRWPVIPILIGCLGFAVTLFLAWNSEHGWHAFETAPHQGSQSVTQSLLQILVVFSPLLLAAIAWALARSALHKPVIYSVAFLYAFACPLLTLDVLTWHTLPWPNAGFGAWLPPLIILLAHHALEFDRFPPKVMFAARLLVLVTAAVQSLMLMHGSLADLTGFVW